MKHTLFAVLATTALSLSAPAFAATQHDRNNAVEQPGAIQNAPGGSGSATNPKGSSSGSSQEMNRENCVPQDQADMSSQDQGKLQAQDQAACPPGTVGEHGGALQNESPSGNSQQHNGNFDKNK